MTPIPKPFEPTRLHERLGTLWGDRLRVRWSSREGTWHIEQKLEQGARQLWPSMVMPRTWQTEINDNFVRRRDGYTFVCRVTRGDRFPCPACGGEMTVPVGSLGIISCDACQKAGKLVRLLGGYWDLGGEGLIDALKSMDPDGRYLQRKSAGERVDEANYAKAYWAERAARNEGRAALMDAYMDAFPKAGFSSLTTQEWRMN